jgi:hypothetical protein
MGVRSYRSGPAGLSLGQVLFPHFRTISRIRALQYEQILHSINGQAISC